MPPESVYLDNAATTPVLPEVRDAMLPYLGAAFGNPSSAHALGRAARVAIERARRQVAGALGADPAAIVFTSGGTEAGNLAVLGRALAARRAGAPFSAVVSAIEHKAILAAGHAVEELGGTCVELPVDDGGRLDRAALDAALRRGPAVVSVMWVNNEIGVVQDATAIAHRCAEAGVWFHSDAVQALGKIPCTFRDFPPTAMLSVSAHKIGGPKGVGALVLPDPKAVDPLVRGGGQQGGVRPGTENVAGIVGFGVAAEMADGNLDAARAHAQALRDTFEAGVQAIIPDATINAAGVPRAPHIANVVIPGTDSEAMLMHLDLAGICCSSGSACSTGSISASHVLTAIGLPTDLATASLRFSFGPQNTHADVDRVLQALPSIVAKVRRLASVLRA
ncbi:MAG TPA: cysteine desulfurase family protein [Gemmatimonadales bacterium]